MKKAISVFAITLILCASRLAFAACTGSSPNWTAADASRTEVGLCVTAASDGDTINVPAGSATWTSGLSINKQISLIGAGIGSTVITNGIGSGYLISYSPGNNSNLFRVSGFSFNLNNLWGIQLTGGGTYPPMKMIRIDHNRFYNSTQSGAAIKNVNAWGVIDHNTFNTMRYPVRLGWGYGSGSYNWSNYNQALYGLEENIYFENNTVTDVSTTITDCDLGGRWAMRYNSFTATGSMSPFSDMHAWKATTSRSCMGGELYGNTFAPTSGRTLAWRGGRATMHHNQAPGGNLYIYNNESNCPTGGETTDLHNNGYEFLNRASATGALLGVSIGSNNCSDITENSTYWKDDETFDGTTGVGSGTLAGRPATCTTGVGYWATNQSTTDLTGMVGVDPSTPIDGTLYKCTSTNNWTAFYTPYTYPHPLTGEEEPGVDTIPAQFSFTDNVDVPINMMIYSAPMSPAVSAIDNDCSISISGPTCEYRVNGAGDWLTAEGNVALNDNVSLRVTSAPTYSTARACTLILGGTVSDTWYATTIAAQAVNYVPIPPRMRAHLRQSPTGYTPPADPGYVGHILPTAAQSVSESPYSNNGWTTPEAIYSAGEASITAATFDAGDRSYILKAFAFDFSSIPDGATIDGVEVIVNARYAVAVVDISLAQLLDVSRAKVGTNQYATPQALTTSAADYAIGGATDAWGNALTAAWVKDPDFGVALGFTAGSSGNSNNDVFVDSVTMKVWYTP